MDLLVGYFLLHLLKVLLNYLHLLLILLLNHFLMYLELVVLHLLHLHLLK
jgi:hypothetical protein